MCLFLVKFTLSRLAFGCPRANLLGLQLSRFVTACIHQALVDVHELLRFPAAHPAAAVLAAVVPTAARLEEDVGACISTMHDGEGLC